MERELHVGHVSAFITKGGWGFITNAEGIKHWFHVSQWTGDTEPAPRMNVAFQISPIRTGRAPRTFGRSSAEGSFGSVSFLINR